MSFTPRVLIVDESSDSREVLAALLARYGATTIEARCPELAVHLAKLHQPDLIVLDADCDRSSTGAAMHDLEAAAACSATPIVILGTVRDARTRLPGGQIVAKHYHYGPLIDRIENLLAAA